MKPIMSSSNAVRAAVYVRISCDDLERVRVERQRADCLKLCPERGWQVIEDPVTQARSRRWVSSRTPYRASRSSWR
jgi:DNA invertase Pin-like site-specific DNA recombinase